MQNKNQVSLTRKTLYWIMLLGLLFSAFGAGDLSSAQAQEVVTETLTPEVQVQETVTPVPEVQATITQIPEVQAQATITPTPEVQVEETVTPTSEVEAQDVNETPSNQYPWQAALNNQHFEPPFPPQKYVPGRDALEGGSSQAESDLNAQALMLGAPGLSFRYLQTFGTTEMPYFSDTTHLNRPEGLFMDLSNNLYVAESQGARILRYNSGGANTLSIGKAGVTYTDDYVLQNPADTAVDSGGNIWVADYSRVVQYTSSGVISQSLPALDDNPWQTGNTNVRFENVRGIAFGSDGRMYVSDSNNHRIQVYTMGTGSPVYETTIGTTGSVGSDNTHFNSPLRIAMYGSSDLYVVDNGNNRVQHCTKSGTWSCATLVSGLNNPQGITVDSSNNVYVADTNNDRILKCIGGTSCSTFVSSTHWSWSYDVAVDSSGNVYSAESWSGTVVKYNSSGNFVSTYVGVDGTPYLTDNYHYNQPRVAIDGSNNIIIVEEAGQRLTKLNAGGVLQWSVGVPGVDNPTDNVHLNWPHGVAVDTAGNIYVADNNRVQIFNGNGTYLNTIGGNWGTGNYEFRWAAGIAVDNNGNIYVSDCQNHRVQIYNSSRTYVTTLGVTGVSGSDNGHLNCPIGIGVDSARNIYVADAGNNRVQKFNSSLVWQMTLGTPGPWGSGSEDFAHFGSGPEDIAVDTQGRIYVADIYNNRVQVFDAGGAYLTTIGGNWGANTSQFRNVSGVDVDSQGNVYVSDFNNARIQKFAPGVPGWQQTNLNGFGERDNRINSMASFGGQLYVGTYNYSENGAQLWRSSDGKNWSSVMTNGFGDVTNMGIDHLIEFDGKLYAGTWNSKYTDPYTTNGGQIWRSGDGTTWERVVTTGFGDATNGEVMRMAVFDNQIYAATWADGIAHGAEIWRSSTGNEGDWTKVVANGLGDITNSGVTTMETFNGYLYAGTYSWNNTTNQPTGREVWRTDGTTWTKVVTDGFGNLNCWNLSSLVTFGDSLYAGTGVWDPDTQTSTGGQVWSCTAASGCDSASDWTEVISDGFGNLQNEVIKSLRVLGARLYAVTENYTTGLEVWNTDDGTNWQQVGFAGFGDSNNQAPYWDNSLTVFNNSLFIGTTNWANGGEIWKSLAPVKVYIGGGLEGSYSLAAGESARQNYPTIDAGPVVVKSDGGAKIVVALREMWNNQATGTVPSTSFAQIVGISKENLSDTYYLPHYNDVSPYLDAQLRFGNVDTFATKVTITIGGVDYGPYPSSDPSDNLDPGESYRINFPTIDAGPVIVKSSNGAKIVVALREMWNNQATGTVPSTSFAQIMGIPKEQLSDTYYLPHYNDVSPYLDAQLRFGNVDSVATKVTITIGGVDYGPYPSSDPSDNLDPGESFRINFPTIDAGPVIVKSSNGAKIVVALREMWNNQATGTVPSTSFAQIMGIPKEQLSDTYYLPHYNDLSPYLDAQLRFGNVDSAATKVTITIGGVDYGPYPSSNPGDDLDPGESFRINFPTIDAGPVIVKSSNGAKIVVALREMWNNQATGTVLSTSFTQIMGIPKEELSDTYYLPHYNDLSPYLDAQLRFGVP